MNKKHGYQKSDDSSDDEGALAKAQEAKAKAVRDQALSILLTKEFADKTDLDTTDLANLTRAEKSLQDHPNTIDIAIRHLYESYINPDTPLSQEQYMEKIDMLQSRKNENRTRQWEIIKNEHIKKLGAQFLKNLQEMGVHEEEAKRDVAKFIEEMRGMGIRGEDIEARRKFS